MSVILNALTFGLLITGVNGIGESADLRVPIAEIVGGAAIGAVFVRRQLGQSAPLLPVDLLARPVFALSLATSIASFAAQSLALVALPFFFEDTLRRSETATGLLMTPWPLATALIAPVAGRLADRFRPGLLGSAGLTVMGAGLVLLALNGDEAGIPALVWRLALCGLGFGFFQSPNNRLIIGSAPPERSGGAAGLQSIGPADRPVVRNRPPGRRVRPGAGARDCDCALDRGRAGVPRRLRERPAQGGVAPDGSASPAGPAPIPFAAVRGGKRALRLQFAAKACRKLHFAGL